MDSMASPIELKQAADALYAQQDYASAAEKYRALLLDQPNSTQVMKQLGLALTLSTQSDEGIKVLQTAAMMQPADADIRYAHGYALGTAGRFDEAITELDAALNLQTNHIPARQGLIFCLLTSGQAIAQVNPVLGEQRLDRAHKLEPKNPHVAAALLDFLHKSGQKGKVATFVKGVEEAARNQSPLKEIIDQIQADPDYAIHMKQVSVAQQISGPKTPNAAPSQTLKQIPCPMCKLPIMDYAAICPHCNARLRATGTFSTHDTGPKYEWQEIAYTIMALIWCALSGFEAFVLFVAMAKTESFAKSMIGMLLFMACARLLVGIGLLFRQEWIAWIAKILCYVSLLTSSIGILLNFGTGRVVDGLISIVQLAIAGFMIYLINYVIGD